MGGGMDHGGETVFFVFSFTLSHRMRVINYQPSSPTARKYPRGVTRNNCKFPWASSNKQSFFHGFHIPKPKRKNAILMN